MFNDYATKKELEDIMARTKPILAGCEKDLKKFSIDNRDVKDAIIEFDKTLSLKADRVNIAEVE